MFYILILPLFLFSCTTDEVFSGKKEKDPDPEPEPDPVALIYEEPLFLYGQEYDEVKRQENDDFYFSELPGGMLVYKRYTADRLEYLTQYHFENNLMIGVSVVFDFTQPVWELLLEGLSSTYETRSETPQTFYNEKTGREVRIERNTAYASITIDY